MRAMLALQRRDDVNWIVADGDVVAVDAATDEVFVLRGAAATLWQVLDGAPLDGMDELVAELFGFGIDEAAAHLRQAIEVLETTGLAEVVGAERVSGPSI